MFSVLVHFKITNMEQKLFDRILNVLKENDRLKVSKMYSNKPHSVKCSSRGKVTIDLVKNRFLPTVKKQVSPPSLCSITRFPIMDYQSVLFVVTTT